jgi:hypothetical protein
MYRRKTTCELIGDVVMDKTIFAAQHATLAWSPLQCDRPSGASTVLPTPQDKAKAVSCVCMPLRLGIYLHKIAVLRTALLDAFSGQRTHNPRSNKPGLRGQTLLQIYPTKIAILGVRAVSKSIPLRRIRAWGPCFRFAGHEHIRNHLNLGYERPKPMNCTTSGDDGALIFKVWVETCNFQKSIVFWNQNCPLYFEPTKAVVLRASHQTRIPISVRHAGNQPPSKPINPRTLRLLAYLGKDRSKLIYCRQ